MDDAAIRILTVCTHNRTRSVMMMAMLQAGLDAALDGERAIVRSSGFEEEDRPPIADAVDAMRRRGLDVATHRSRRVTPAGVDGADLILTAERDHVVRIGAMSPVASSRAFTLPEFLERSTGSPRRPDQSIGEWVTDMSAGRTSREYLAGEVGEVVDPTGWGARRFEAAVVELAAQCDDVVSRLAGRGGAELPEWEF